MITAQKIAVMQAHEADKSIEYRERGDGSWLPALSPTWNWHGREYRVVTPKPVKVTKYVVVDRDGDQIGTWKDARNEADNHCAAVNHCGHHAPYVVGEVTYETLPE